MVSLALPPALLASTDSVINRAPTSGVGSLLSSSHFSCWTRSEHNRSSEGWGGSILGVFSPADLPFSQGFFSSNSRFRPCTHKPCGDERNVPFALQSPFVRQRNMSRANMRRSVEACRASPADQFCEARSTFARIPYRSALVAGEGGSNSRTALERTQRRHLNRSDERQISHKRSKNSRQPRQSRVSC